MNTQQIIESIKQVFPNLTNNQIRLDLDSSQKKLASETGELKTRAALSNISTNFAWVLPTGFIGIDDITFYDSNNNPKYLSDFSYKYEIEFGKLFIYTTGSTPITGLDSSIAYAYIHYRELPATLTSESTSMEVSEQFRDAIESDVLGKYFSKFPIDTVVGGQVVKILNLQAAQLHKNEYEKLRIKLKKYLGSQSKSSGEAQYYQHAGAQILPRRPNDTTSGTSVLSLASLSELYTKYAYFKITTADDQLELDPDINIGYTTVTATPEVGMNTITLASTGEFDESAIITINNWDVSWVRKSSSEIVFTLPTGWTNFTFEIYERS